jgi:pimeloyl-ACP methyl ester carboxylesterase
MMAGMGLDAHASFKNTFHNAEPDNYRLCFYERAGTGKSAYKEPKVRKIIELVEEMEQFTLKVGMDELVLVPHSFGGFVARAFTNRNPNKVKGIVFVDAAHESWYADMKSSMSANAWKTMELIMDWERNQHSFEDFAEASSHSDLYSIRADMPVIVMSRGIPHVSIRQTKMSYQDVDVYTNSWNRSQQQLKKISNDVQPVTMHYASHLFDETDPWIVIDNIDKMVLKVTTKLNNQIRPTDKTSH